MKRARSRSPIDDDETVTAYPALAWWDGDSWKLELQLWFYEPEEDSLKRKLLLDTIGDTAGLPEGSEDAERLRARTRPFLYDNEGGEELTVVIGSLVAELPETRDDGRVRATIEVPTSVMPSSGGTLRYEVVVPEDEERRFTATAHFVSPRGVFLVSDIDDTVKVSDVLDRAKLARRTLLEPFAFVTGTPEAYARALGKSGHLHFLSGSPWQLYEPLAEGLSEAGFPPATFTLKEWRPGRLDLERLLADPFEAKLGALEDLVSRFPERTFILVGDSGERDPEVYGAFTRAHPKRVAHVASRNVTGQKADDPRYLEAFRDVDPKKWEIYDDPKSLFGEPTPVDP